MLLLGAALGAVGLWLVQRDTTESVSTEATEVSTTTREAEQRDLVSSTEWAATLQAGTSAVVSATARGTITANSEVGDRIELGDVIAEIDANPVVALYGTVPQFRELGIDTASGADVRQLEENLVALGYDEGETVVVDETFTDSTGEMVQRWETDLGIESPDAVVSAGQIAFIAGPSEVATRSPVGSQVANGQALATTVTLAESGFLALPIDVAAIRELASPGDQLTPGQTVGEVDTGGASLPLVTVIGDPDIDNTDAVDVSLPEAAVVVRTLLEDTEFVTAGRPIYLWETPQGSIELEVEVAEAGTFPVGQPVEVELPDGQLIAAAVDSVSNVARTVQDGGNAVTIVDVNVQPTSAIESDFTSGPVTVRVQDDAILGATVIPVRSLVALAEGGHAVEVEGRGFVPVDLGAFDDGWVEVVNGTIEPGEVLVVPS